MSIQTYELLIAVRKKLASHHKTTTEELSSLYDMYEDLQMRHDAKCAEYDNLTIANKAMFNINQGITKRHDELQNLYGAKCAEYDSMKQFRNNILKLHDNMQSTYKKMNSKYYAMKVQYDELLDSHSTMIDHINSAVESVPPKLRELVSAHTNSKLKRELSVHDSFHHKTEILDLRKSPAEVFREFITAIKLKQLITDKDKDGQQAKREES